MKTAHAIVFGALTLGCATKESNVSDAGDDMGTTGADVPTGGDVPTACVQAGWDTSLAAYETLAEQAGDTYWYSTLTFEFLDGFSWACSYRTTIEFVAGAAVRRTFELAELADGTLAEQCTGTPFVEEGDAIGTMDGTFDFTAYSMEQLYDGCCALLSLEPPEMYLPHFEVDDDGVVDACYAIYNNCGEGCEASADGFAGFDFEAFGFGTPP
jgi:hypothetical protein